MIWYLFFFLLIFVGACFSHYRSRGCIPVFRNIVSALFLFAISLFFGYRDYDVGFDVTYYGYADFRYSCFAADLLQLFSVSNNEILYLCLNYISSFFSCDYHLCLSLFCFVSLGCCWWGANTVGNRISVPVFVSIYLLFFFVGSLNLLRQSLAASVSLFAFLYYQKTQNLYKLVLLMIIAFLFHKSSLLVGLYLVCVYSTTPETERGRFKMLIVIFIMTIGSVVALGWLLQYLAVIIPGFDKYLTYLDSSGEATWKKPQFPKMYFVLMCLLWLLSIIAKKKSWVEDKNLYYLRASIIIVWGIMMMGQYTGSMLRLLIYFIPITIYYSLEIVSSRRIHFFSRIVLNSLFIIFALFYFIKSFDVTLYYKSEILGL